MRTDLVALPPERDLPPSELLRRRQHLLLEARATLEGSHPRRVGGGGTGRRSVRMVALAAAVLVAVALSIPALGVGPRIVSLFAGGHDPDAPGAGPDDGLQVRPVRRSGGRQPHAYQSARAMADNLQAALESRAVIDQAKGVLIERYKLTPDQAFQLLAQASMHANRKVRDIADVLVRTGELPVTTRRDDRRAARRTPGPGRPTGG